MWCRRAKRSRYNREQAAASSAGEARVLGLRDLRRSSFGRADRRTRSAARLKRAGSAPRRSCVGAYCFDAASVTVPLPVMPIAPSCSWIKSPLPSTQYGDVWPSIVIVVPDTEYVPLVGPLAVLSVT
jgi:hypothetical protein